MGKKICLSVSAHHPEHWQPAWGIRTIITALIAFFPTKVCKSGALNMPKATITLTPVCPIPQAEGALAGLDYTDAERRNLASASRGWQCARCKLCMSEVLPLADSDASVHVSSLPPPPAELTFAHEATPTGTPTQAAGEAASSSAGAPSQEGPDRERPSLERPVEAPPTDEEALRAANISGEAQPSHPSPARSTPPAVPAPASTARHTPQTRPARASHGAASAAAAGGAVDWLGMLAACLVALISLLVAKKLMDEP